MMTAIHTAVKGRVRYKLTELYGSVPQPRLSATLASISYAAHPSSPPDSPSPVFDHTFTESSRYAHRASLEYFHVEDDRLGRFILAETARLTTIVASWRDDADCHRCALPGSS